jgi:hypothetical protein
MEIPGGETYLLETEALLSLSEIATLQACLSFFNSGKGLQNYMDLRHLKHRDDAMIHPRQQYLSSVMLR